MAALSSVSVCRYSQHQSRSQAKVPAVTGSRATAFTPCSLTTGAHVRQQEMLCFRRASSVTSSVQNGRVFQPLRAVDTEVATETASQFVDEEAMLAASTFPIPPEELIEKAKYFLSNLMDQPDLMAEDFQFIAPVVGPLGKEQLMKALGSFDLTAGIPDLNAQNHHFRVDPFDTSRVWYTSRTKGTHTGTLAGRHEATGTEIEGPPQSCSVKFNEEGQVVLYTIGYVMDKNIGNTGGLGGVFGIFYAIGAGLPFPEAQPWKMSKRYRFFNWLGSFRSS